jgi:hypothetical protein
MIGGDETYEQDALNARIARYRNEKQNALRAVGWRIRDGEDRNAVNATRRG